jgi:hypothetical protein
MKKATKRRVVPLRNPPNCGPYFAYWSKGPKPEYGSQPCPRCGIDVDPGTASLSWKSNVEGAKYAHVETILDPVRLPHQPVLLFRQF